MNLEACLPASLRGAATTITRVAAGLSGAGVYRVDANGQTFAMKVVSEGQPMADWRRKLHIQQLAAEAGLAPRIVHVDDERRVVVSDFVVDRSFAGLYFDPRTRDAALTQLGQTLRRVHELPMPSDTGSSNPRDYLALIWSGLVGRFIVPAFVTAAVTATLAEEPPDSGRALVLSHNDVNPTNLVYDGERVLLLDWETTGPNDPFFDLAAISVFFRMDDASCRHLLSAHDGEPVAALPARFAYDRRVAAVMCGAGFLHLARNNGHVGAAGDETLESTLGLAEFYQQMRTGALSIASGDGQWAFGLALVKAGVTV